MPYPFPTAVTLQRQAASDITSSELAGADGFLPRAILPLLGLVQAGFAFGHYDALAYVARQSTPFTATDEWLEAWAALKKVFRKDATAAGSDGNSYAVFSGAPGAPLPAGSSVIGGNATYATIAAAEVGAGGTVTVPIAATVAGSIGNAPAGSLLTLGGGILDINAAGSASTAITYGTDQELDEDLRTRMLFAYANPPAGGDQADYVSWALACAGVTRAWCTPNGFGAGTVVVYVMLDNAEAAAGGFPQGSNGVAAAEPRDVPATGDQLAVANAIYPQRPVTALVYVCAAVADPVNYVVADLAPNTPAVAAGIAAALASMHLRSAAPGGTLYPSDWNEAVASVPGILHFAITAPTMPVTAPAGSLPVVGTISYPAP